MKRRRKFKIFVSVSLLLILISALCMGALADDPPPPTEPKGTLGIDLGHVSEYSKDATFVPGELIVGLKDPGSAGVLAAQLAGEVVASIDVLNAYLITLPSPPRELDAAEKQLNQAIDMLQADGNVAWVEPNYVGHISDEPNPSDITLTPNDPDRTKQWALNTNRLNMYNAWNRTTGSTHPRHSVAILDTGADMDHEDLDGKLLTDRDWDFVNNDSNPQDDHNHGSHCAGIAAAETNNSRGIAGVAWNNRIIANKVCDYLGRCTAWDVARGIIWATMKKATVISISLGFDSPSDVMQAAAEFAWGSDVVLVAAAGNDDAYVASYPASFDSVISVASTNYSDSRSAFSNYHSTVEIAAPGGTDYPYSANDIWSCNRTGGYMYMAGTSMATPQVAGAVGLYRGRYPWARATRVRACLRWGVDDKGSAGWDQYYGWGRLDVDRLLQCSPRGGRVLIDNTHSNVSRSANDLKYSYVRGLAEDLLAQGWDLAWTSDVGLTSSSLASREVLILLDPENAYSASERTAISNWLRDLYWSRRIIAGCEWGPYNENSEINQLLSQIGSGIQCADSTVYEPTQHDKMDIWPIFTTFNRNQRLNTSIYETGYYGGTYLTLSSPAVELARTTSSATEATVDVIEGQITDAEYIAGEDGLLEVEISDIKQAPFIVAARSMVGARGGRVWVFGDTNWMHGEHQYRSPNNRLWFENTMGAWE